jgi:glutamate-ammonia-ligase adenylyltransferase
VLAELEARFALTAHPRFAIVGLGKLGGNELNYSSDIDLLFVYERECELTQESGRAVSCEEFFNRLGEQLVVRLSEQSPEGTLYRVDMRLRPESGAGPLARSLQSYLLYYEARGELWERQMLLKARAVGGDRELGEEFLRRLEPFVYPRSFLQHPAESVARIKARIEASAGDPEDVKLMRGGIRDVEFTVQTLQLLGAGKNPDLRTGSTLEAIERLVAHGELSSADGRALREAYELFRRLEHRLQTQLNTQTHALPRQEPQRNVLARLAGFADAARMDEAVGAAAAGARQVFDAVLSVPVEPVRSGLQAMLEGGAGEDAVASLLASFGIRDVRRALKSIRVLSSGSALTGVGDARLRGAFHRIAAQLLEEISQTPSPDQTLSTLGLLVSAQRFPHQLVELLGDERFRRLAVEVCSMGPRLARMLTTHPLLLETLATDPSALARSPIGRPGAGESLIGWKQREELRALVRHVLGFSTFEALTHDLAAIADAILAGSLAHALRRARVTAPLVIAAVGKYGSRELGVDADLDLFFVGRTRRAAQLTSLERCAAAVVQAVSVVSADGTLYTVDTRLRPEGRNAPLAVELSSYRRYLQTRASLWERQSLTRLRVVAGQSDLARQVENAVEEFVYDSPLPDRWVEEIMSMRAKTEARSRVRRYGDLDLKLGAGGMMDIEFLTQMIQLHQGRAHAEFRRASVLEVLRIVPRDVLAEDEASLLSSAYTLFRRVETLMRITLEERTTILPDGDSLELLGVMMGRGSATALHDEVRSAMQHVRPLLTAAARRLQP